MHAGQAPLHYAPASVGALMDPAFVRDAVHDAEGEHRNARGTRREAPQWRKVLRRALTHLLGR